MAVSRAGNWTWRRDADGGAARVCIPLAAADRLARQVSPPTAGRTFMGAPHGRAAAAGRIITRLFADSRAGR